MTFRPGTANPRHGARLPRPKGPFCVDCKDPETAGNKVIIGLWGYIRLNLELPLCERCIRDRYPRMDPDPLTLEDVA